MSDLIIIGDQEEGHPEPKKRERYFLHSALIKGYTLEAGPNHASIMVEAESVSDGHHTMDELYEHRNLLFCALLKALDQQAEAGRDVEVWRSKKHSDGTMYDGWFIAGAVLLEYEGSISSNTMITYHLPLSMWDDLNRITEFEFAPEFDGYTSKDVLERLRKYYL